MLALLYRRSAPATDHPIRGAEVHTSGSAGVPKAVLHTCGHHYSNALGSNVNLPPTAEDR